jgi:hypothetical protein
MLCIHVEDTELPVGLKMQLGNIQALLTSRFPDQEKFYARLFDALPEETRGIDRDGVPVPPTTGKAKRHTTQGAPLWKKYKMAFIAAAFVLVLGLSALVAVNLPRKETPPPSPVTMPSSAVVAFADAKLEQAFRDELAKPKGAITVADLNSMTGALSLKGLAIQDITPLQHLTKLTVLDLEDNKIIDISSLQALTDLAALGLGGNGIKDISPLKPLKKLMSLTIDNNPIDTIEPLAALKNLQILSIEGVAVRERDLQLGKYMRRLQEVTVNAACFTNITPEQVRVFRTDMPPNCKIITADSADNKMRSQ